MRYQIDTAPVWDAFKKGAECPLCEIRRLATEREIRYFLGESVMEPQQRMEVNRDYFCAEHLRSLYAQANRLGLGLMTHTYIKNMLPRLRAADDEALKAAKRDSLKPAPLRKKTRNAVGAIRELGNKCVICRRMRENMDRYAYTVLYMYGHDGEFRELYSLWGGKESHTTEQLSLSLEENSCL